MIEIGEHADGWVLPVRAQPGASKTGVQGEQGGALKVAVTAPPEDGRANKALTETLHSKRLGPKRSQVELLSGDKSRDKKFLIRGVSVKRISAWTAGEVVGTMAYREPAALASRDRGVLAGAPRSLRAPGWPLTSTPAAALCCRRTRAPGTPCAPAATHTGWSTACCAGNEGGGQR